MQKRWLVLLTIALLLFVVPAITAQDTPLPDLGGREITIAVENAYPPYNFINEDGEAVGWDYDTFNDICELINCVPVYVETAWDGMLVAIANGEYDVAADGITYTEDRDETVDFSSLYQAYDETLLVREGEDRFTNADELLAIEDAFVGTQIGTTNEITALSFFPAERVNSFDTFGAAIQALLNGDVDAVLVDRPAAEGWIESQGGLMTLESSIGDQQGLAFAFPSGSDLVEPINAAMAALQASGRWDQIYTRWFVTPEVPDLEGRELTIAVENAYPPYNFINEDGEAVGWDYDTFNAICELLNCVPVYVETAWDGMLVAIANGEYDVAADGITYTEDRDETVDFSSLYQAYDETLLVREGEDRFTNADELLAIEDAFVGTQIGTTNEITALSFFPAENVNSFDTFGAAIQALLNGDVDAVLVDRPAAEGWIESQGGLMTLESSIGDQQGLAFAFPSGSDLVEPINAAMAALQANGVWDDIYETWFEAE
ncbi:MAG: transporter substrate-binding domain-containing protein [Chloroflexi bacterium]|uniref:transporter substrate-binding domain-containing protein n=1 Tax=Candidatus Flexifilum breve TaxID=3140694 RepID=UPI0031373DDC|nr:transporter substrate-binding domain-containing protein [Chloroflexota bacterium]